MKLRIIFLPVFFQVTIEVVDSADTDPENEMQKESKASWPVPSPDWRSWWQRSSTLPRLNYGGQDYKYDSTTEDSNFLNPLGGWNRQGLGHRTFDLKEQPDYGKLMLHISCHVH